MAIITFFVGLIIGLSVGTVVVFKLNRDLFDNIWADNEKYELTQRLAFSRIDELEARCSRLHENLLQALKRRNGLPVEYYQIREGDYNRHIQIYRN